MPDLVGTTIGHYEIVEVVGRGGMSTVYKGYQAALDRYVAVKVLDPTISSDELFLTRFQREAQAVALLRHPHIVQIHDFGNIDEMYYMVMEYVDGQSLRERLRAAASEGEYMPIHEVLGIVWAIASALDYAYQRGIIHRDIKPGNILLSSDGQAVLGDFGIAQLMKSSRLTLSGLVGTPNYMSPEQGQGLEIDQRTDIYSLGIVTYEMLGNQVPFSSDTPFAVVMAHVTRPLPPLQQIRPAILPAVQDVLVKGTAKDKEQRYHRSMEFAESLEAACTPMLQSTAGEESLLCARCHSPLDPAQRFCGKCGAPASPPAMSSLVEALPETASFRLEPPEPVSTLASSSAGDTTPSSLPSSPAAMMAGCPPAPPEAITPPSTSGPTVSPNRSRSRTPLALVLIALILLCLLVVGGVMLLSEPEAQEVAVAQPTATASRMPASAASTDDSDVATSVAFLTPGEGLPSTQEVAALREVQTAAPAEIPERGSMTTPTVYVGIVVSPKASLELTPKVTATRRHAAEASQSLMDKIVFWSDRDGEEALYVMNPDGSDARPLEDLAAYQEAVNRESLSPDGKERLRVQDNAGSWDIYMIPADEHKPPMAITSHAAADYDPVWSPTEDLIAFVSLRTDGNDAIFVMTPDGRNDRQLTFNAGALDKHPTWSPDGTRIAFGSNLEGKLQIYVIDKDGSGQSNISNNSFNDWEPVWVE
jgi:serine/threonine protein kinase